MQAPMQGYLLSRILHFRISQVNYYGEEMRNKPCQCCISTLTSPVPLPPTLTSFSQLCCCFDDRRERDAGEGGEATFSLITNLGKSHVSNLFLGGVVHMGR